MERVIMSDIDELDRIDAAQLLGSLLLFTRVFFKLRTGREFYIGNPVTHESHYITVFRELTRVFNMETTKLLINIPPGHGKSEIMIHFIAWTLAHYPDSQYIYISSSASLAENHTSTIKRIVELPTYRRLFGIQLRSDTQSKANFQTTAGGAIKAFGSQGQIVGQNAGIPYCPRFSGGVFMDDMHKPDEVFSDTIRQGVIDNYNNTIQARARGENVSQVFLGQRLHEIDLPGHLLAGGDGYHWDTLILPAINEKGHVLAPELKSFEWLETQRAKNDYVFYSQYQQNPIPPTGEIFKPEWFITLEQEPEILSTFITADTAESAKDYNDATVFSFWGVYKLYDYGIDTGLIGIHWIACNELRVEPCNLKSEFMQFFSECARYPVVPKFAAIEKKSTGVTLISVLKELRGLQIVDLERTAASGNKAARYNEIQQYIASKQVSFPMGAKHRDMCVEHCRKITRSMSHKHDDIADTLYDAIKIAIINKSALLYLPQAEVNKHKALPLGSQVNYLSQVRGSAYATRK